MVRSENLWMEVLKSECISLGWWCYFVGLKAGERGPREGKKRAAPAAGSGNKTKDDVWRSAQDGMADKEE